MSGEEARDTADRNPARLHRADSEPALRTPRVSQIDPVRIAEEAARDIGESVRRGLGYPANAPRFSIGNASFVLSERARRAIVRSREHLGRNATLSEGNALDSVRENLDARFDASDSPVLELHPNVIVEREFEFLYDSLCSADNERHDSDNTENRDNHDRDELRLPPTEGDARSNTPADTPSEISGRGEFSLTSYDSDVFDPTEEEFTPRASNMSQQRVAQDLAPRVDITPAQIEEEIQRLQGNAPRNGRRASRAASANVPRDLPVATNRGRAPEPPRENLGARDSTLDDILLAVRGIQARVAHSEAANDELLHAVRNIQDRISRVEVTVYDRPDDQARRGTLDVTYGRSHHDIRNQPGHHAGFLSLKEARNMIPEINGESRERVREFLSASSYAMKNIQPADGAMLLEAILCTKFKGKAMTDFDTREIRDFEQLKRELEAEYLGKRGVTHLQLEFNSLRQKPGENAQDFGRRVEKLARELYEAMEEGQGHSQDQQKAILDIIKMQALHNFQIGLHDDIKMLVRAQRYTSLQEAIAGANAEEKVKGPSLRTGQVTKPKIITEDAQSAEAAAVRCHNCGKTGHYRRDCRQANKFSLPRADKAGNINIIECTYCKKAGHKREECWSLNGRPNTERPSRSKTDAPKKAPVNGLKVRKKKSRGTSDESSCSSGSEEDERPRKNKTRAAEEYQVSQITGKHNIHTLNSITLPIQEARKGKMNFLLDSGAILTLIKVGNLKGDTMVREKRLTLTGVTGHKIHTLGRIKATVNLGKQRIRHTMYVVEDNFPIDYEGILGNDFLTKRKAVISHATKRVHIGRSTLQLQTYKQEELPCNRVGIVKGKEPTPRIFIGHCLMEPTVVECPKRMSKGMKKSAIKKCESNLARREGLRAQLPTAHGAAMDASDFATRAVCNQRPAGQVRPNTCASRKLSKAKLRFDKKLNETFKIGDSVINKGKKRKKQTEAKQIENFFLNNTKLTSCTRGSTIPQTRQSPIPQEDQLSHLFTRKRGRPIRKERIQIKTGSRDGRRKAHGPRRGPSRVPTSGTSKVGRGRTMFPSSMAQISAGPTASAPHGTTSRGGITEYLQSYLDQVRGLCHNADDSSKDACYNIIHVTEDNNVKLTQLLLRLQTMYKTTTSRRGLINAIGTIGKTLFGTMDADDAQHIQKQLETLHDQQKTLQHAAKHQIKIINATLGHIETLEQTLNRNEKLIANVTKRVQQRVAKLIRREEIDEQLIVVSAITTKLVSDVVDTLEYLTYTKHGIIPTRLLPLETIVAELREATAHLSRGAHFPFKVQLENWNVIQRFVKINAYYDSFDVYTILTFPIIAYPCYEVVRVIPLPVYDSENIFVIPKISYNLLAINRENRNYLTMEKGDLDKCIQVDATYVCDVNYPVYFITAHAPCEVQIYVRMQKDSCERRHILSNVTLWITLAERQTWLFSTPGKQQINIQCNDQADDKTVIHRSGKIRLNDECKLTTTDLTLRTKKRENTKVIQMHLPQFNLTFKSVAQKVKDNKELETELRLEPVINDPAELTRLSMKLEKVNEELEDNQVSLLSNKYVIYPVGSVSIVVIIIGIIAIIV